MRLSAITPAGREQGGARSGSAAKGTRLPRVAAKATHLPPVAAGGPRPSRATGGAKRTAGVAGSPTRAPTRAAGAATRAGRPIAARPVAARPAAAGVVAAPGHPRRLRPAQAPTAPRRVSGPVVRERAAAGGAPPRGRVQTPERPRPKAPPRPTPQKQPGPRRQPQTRQAPLEAARQRASAFLRSLPDHRLIDRLVRGRAWIPVLGLMLAGIVTMQVEVLKLGANVGRSIESGSALQTRNEQLRASVASLSDDGRIERLAAGMGMIMPTPGSAGFLSGAGVAKAVANIHEPSSSTFLSSGGANGSVATTDIMSSSSGVILAASPSTASSSTASTSATATATPSPAASAASAATTSATASPATSTTTAPTTTTTTTAPTTTGDTTTGATASTPSTGISQSQQQSTSSTGG
jgi:hypothetical protein